jgi:hypothetical protein
VLVTIERSHGKARPTLPRATDLPVPPPSADRRVGRDQKGRFAPGHRQSARSRGWRRAVAQLSTGLVPTAEQAKLAGDSGTLYRATLAVLPCESPLTNPIAAEHARSAVLSTHFAAAALEAGVTTVKGKRLLEMSLKLGQRAERTAVSLLDLTTRLAEAERKRAPSSFPWLTADADEPESEPDASPASAHTSGEAEGAAEPADAATRQPNAPTSGLGPNGASEP